MCGGEDLSFVTIQKEKIGVSDIYIYELRVGDELRFVIYVERYL